MPPPIPARPADTSPEAERVQVELVRTASIAQRLRRASALSDTVTRAARRALARARPHATKRELDLWFVELHYGRPLAQELRGELERRDRAQSAHS